MTCTNRFTALLLALGMTVATGCDRSNDQATAGQGHGSHGSHDSHGGHGHGEDDGPDPISVTIFTPKVQLFMEYPHLVEGHEAEFLAHVTVLATGEPVRSGTMSFEAKPADGDPVNLKLDAPRRDGLFVPQWKPSTAGTYGLTLKVDSPQIAETIQVGELIVHANDEAALAAASETDEAKPPNVVPFLLEQQWKIGLLMEQVERRTLTHRLTLPGKIVAPQGASAVVSPPVAGRLMPPPDGKLPRIGETVQAGQVLAVVEPPLPSTEVAQLSANLAQTQALETELALRQLELETKALEVERSLVQARARLDYAQRTIKREKELRDKGVSTDKQYEEAEQNLRLAEAELQSAQAMKQSLEDARQRLTKLRAETTVRKDDAGATAENQLPLRAPISGQIVSVEHIEGEHLDDAHQEVFRIINTDHVWVEANISEFDLAQLADSPGAAMTLAAYPDKAFDIFGAGGRLVNIGSVVDPETRTLSVVYEIPNPDRVLRIGMLAEVHLETEKAVETVAIPEQAIVMDNGRPIGFVLLDGENFQKRELELGIRDGGFVEVIDGINESERVVTKGGYIVKLSSLSPASFGHGHGH